MGACCFRVVFRRVSRCFVPLFACLTGHLLALCVPPRCASSGRIWGYAGFLSCFWLFDFWFVRWWKMAPPFTCGFVNCVLSFKSISLFSGRGGGGVG